MMMITPLTIGSLTFDHNLIQGPLAGYSCAAFRRLFYFYIPPAYCVTEMLSAYDVVTRHKGQERYLLRDSLETYLCYQIAGSNADIMAKAAMKLESLGADLIDINCGCPKTKIRKKGYGSALAENPEQLLRIVETVRVAINCPLTVKLRLCGEENDIALAKRLENAGVDAIIIHGRRWYEDYDIPCDRAQIAAIKAQINIPLIANGDVKDSSSLSSMFKDTKCDAVMIGRAGTGKPWLYSNLLNQSSELIQSAELKALFLLHLEELTKLEGEYSAVLQSRSLMRYYFRERVEQVYLSDYYQFLSLSEIKNWLKVLEVHPG